MNIRRYITALLLLFGCIISMSAVAVPDVRSVVSQDGAVVESTDYYPYGTPFTTAGAVQPYKYGTKELDRMHGLDLYDSQARWDDSLTGRTSTIDPKAEKYYNRLMKKYLRCWEETLYKGNGLTLEDAIGAIATHEARHATDKNANERFEPSECKREELAGSDEKEYINERINER